MKIKRIQGESFIDYPGKISAVLFNGDCNYRCPACHSQNLFEDDKMVSGEEIFSYLESRKGWIGGVVLCGGEPTLQPDIVNFVKKLKDLEFKVKLDTNGSKPEILTELLEKKLVDYIAMDIKGPPRLYPNIIGRWDVDLKDIENGMKIATKFPDYEFRTTIVPIDREKELTMCSRLKLDSSKISLMNVKEIKEMGKWVCDVTQNNEHKFYLQKFVPRENGLIDYRMEKFPETSDKLMNQMYKSLKSILPNCEIR